jgi:toxin ParE1/3/4
MKVHWTKTAEDHLDDIYRYIGRDSPEYAQRTVDRLTSRSRQIGAFPSSGRQVPEFKADSIREVLEGSYRIIYRIKKDRIDVLAVIHGAMDILKR